MADRFDFATLRRPWTPNTYLVLPEDFAAAAEPDRVSPVFAAPPERLAAAVLAVAGAEPRTTLVDEDEPARRYRFVQRSRVFRFPDDIAVQIVEAGETRSALAIYSRARYGIRDFGVNRARIERWLDAIAQHLADDEAEPDPAP